jgi:energy-coupling factor transporter ATP-binding protein EcfA2
MKSTRTAFPRPASHQRLRRSLLLSALQRPLGNLRRSTLRQISPLLEGILGVPEETLDAMAVREVRRLARDKLASLPRSSAAELLRPYRQLRRLGEQLGLSEIDQGLLVILTWLKLDEAWKTLNDVLGELSGQQAASLLAGLLGVRPSEVQAALHPDGVLVRSGLLRKRKPVCTDLQGFYDILDGLDDYALRTARGWNTLMAQTFSRCDAEARCLRDFAWLGSPLEATIDVLRGSLEARHRGIHVLLYGAPGTGKTTLARVLAAAVEAELLGVPTEDEDAKGADGTMRFRWLAVGQRLLAGSTRRMFLFDEAEDVFLAHLEFLFRDTRSLHKGWINEMLESTTVPTIWTSNDLSGTDRAHLRRFTCILEVPSPPRSVRRRLLLDTLAGREIRPEWIDHVAEHEGVTPGEIAQLGTALRATPARGEAAETLLGSILREKLPALGAKPLRRAAGADGLQYDPAYLNTAPGAGRVIASLAGAARASVLLYGPPGTGKSELVRHLSRVLDRPLIVNQASDLISMWLGQTEKNIARAFSRAEREQAILFLDEADSFLRSREGAVRSWEVTQVNEVLVGMEAFDGIFIAATNLIDDLDPAAFRRFDLKVRFESLRLEQKIELVASLVDHTPSAAGITQRELSSRLARMDQLTLGDFRAAVRSLRLTASVIEAWDLLEALREEYRFKEGGRRQSIGFVN